MPTLMTAKSVMATSISISVNPASPPLARSGCGRPAEPVRRRSSTTVRRLTRELADVDDELALLVRLVRLRGDDVDRVRHADARVLGRLGAGHGLGARPRVQVA